MEVSGAVSIAPWQSGHVYSPWQLAAAVAALLLPCARSEPKVCFVCWQQQQFAVLGLHCSQSQQKKQQGVLGFRCPLAAAGPGQATAG
jgi:hypothetical protein